jgi:general secretion pathway protein A
MYEEHFGFREPPFRITPDPRFLYRNPCVEEAAAALAYGIERRKGFLSLVGEAGTGKTTLLRHVLDTLSGNVRTVVLLHPTVEFDEILEYILGELGVPVEGGRKLVLLQRLHEFLVEHTRAGGNVALIVDEAQDLEPRVLEELRLLSNLETGTEKILQIVLAGQPELETKLADPGLRQLRQRIALHVRLRPLSPDEVAVYITTRLEFAGSARTDVFTREASERIAVVSQGIPRVVNVLCDACLVTAYALNTKQVTAHIVDEAWTDYSRLVGDLPERPAPEPVVVRAPEPASARSVPVAPPAPAVTPAPAPPPPSEPVAARPVVAPRPPEPAAAPRPTPTPPLEPIAPPARTSPRDDEPAPALFPDGDGEAAPAATLRSPWWDAPRAVTVVTVLAIVVTLGLNVFLRGTSPNRDATPTPETVVAHVPVVSEDANPQVTAASPGEARALVHEFLLAYEARDATRVAGLFAADATENDRIGADEIRADYERRFAAVRDVSVTVPRIDTALRGERLTITGPIVVAYRDQKGTMIETRGTAQWEIARLGGTPRILRLRHDVDPQTS